MFILKFFASLFLLFFAVVIIFVVISFLIAKKAVTDLNESLSEKFSDNQKNSSDNFDNDNIPEAIECSKCGTYYAELPADKLCSCGAKLG